MTIVLVRLSTCQSVPGISEEYGEYFVWDEMSRLRWSLILMLLLNKQVISKIG